MVKKYSQSFYWCAASSDDNEEMSKDKWLSLINHIHNKHQHSGLFKNFAHGNVYHNKKWFTPHLNSNGNGNVMEIFVN